MSCSVGVYSSVFAVCNPTRYQMDILKQKTGDTLESVSPFLFGYIQLNKDQVILVDSRHNLTLEGDDNPIAPDFPDSVITAIHEGC